MANLKELRRRIKSVSSTARVTKAMQMIAAAKMRKAQQKVVDGRPYSEKIHSILSHLNFVNYNDEDFELSIHENLTGSKELCLMITPDRGLCGALVSNITRVAISNSENVEEDVVFITIGKKASSLIVRLGKNLKAQFGVSDMPEIQETLAVSKLVMDELKTGQYRSVSMIYSEFISTSIQKPVKKNLIPVEISEDEKEIPLDYIFEPDIEKLLNTLIPRYIEMEIYHGVLEATASEHSARMVSMQNATDNANELLDDLTLELNKARQQVITSELLDLVGGMIAQEG
ncbi:MAG: ATP synthase F1 subunit gamma [Chloroflexi bacterium]|nr:ATP synthase F1 subunit gamma [Chloroflexota bacterium]|tara:strand:- start:16164 stop:17024 length:861 start_codon:yes stop_codon:yes gene_type:complete